MAPASCGTPNRRTQRTVAVGVYLDRPAGAVANQGQLDGAPAAAWTGQGCKPIGIVLAHQIHPVFLDRFGEIADQHGVVLRCPP